MYEDLFVLVEIRTIMPRGTTRRNKSGKSAQIELSKPRKAETIADNLNDNHATLVRSNCQGKLMHLDSDATVKSPARKPKPKPTKNHIKSKVVKRVIEQETHEFEENGEVVEMEVNEGDTDFASEEEGSEVATSDKDSDSECKSELSDSHEMHNESGEITSDYEEQRTSITEDDEKNMSLQLPAWQKKKKTKRQSIEEMEVRLNSMSDTLMAVKEMLMQKEGQKTEHDKGKDPNEEPNTNQSMSDTTIYCNVLEKVKVNEVILKIRNKSIQVRNSIWILMTSLLQIAKGKLKEERGLGA